MSITRQQKNSTYKYFYKNYKIINNKKLLYYKKVR